jgi:glycerate 2-kinase
MHILIAPNAYKHSATAADAANAIAKGLRRSKLSCSTECFPIGDGGDGTSDLIIEKLNGKRVEVNVRDPLGRRIAASFGIIDSGKTAIIGMAEASGIRLLSHNELNPLQASSVGTGELICSALDHSVTKIIISMGGSATVDGGAGILSALGVKFLDNEKEICPASPESLMNLTSLDLRGIDQRIFNCEIIVLCDVDNQLLGDQGAAAVFGPQKGADLKDIDQLEHFLSRFAEAIHQGTKKDITALKRGGTAGGAAAGLCAVLDARLVNGIDYFLELTKFDEALEKSDMLITGEGSIDLQTLNGKGPFGVAQRAKAKGLPVIAIAGKVPDEEIAELRECFDIIIPIGNSDFDKETALKSTIKNLTRTSMEMGNLLALGNYTS